MPSVSPSGATRRTEMVHRHDAGRTLHVLDGDGWVPRDEAAEVARDRARRGIDAAARRIADDHGQRLALVEVGGGGGPCRQGPDPTAISRPQELHRLPNQ